MRIGAASLFPIPLFLPAQTLPPEEVLYALVETYKIPRQAIGQTAGLYALFRGQLPDRFAFQHVYNAVQELRRITSSSPGPSPNARKALQGIVSKYVFRGREAQITLEQEAVVALWGLGGTFSGLYEERLETGIMYLRAGAELVSQTVGKDDFLRQTVCLWLGALEAAWCEVQCLRDIALKVEHTELGFAVEMADFPASDKFFERAMLTSKLYNALARAGDLVGSEELSRTVREKQAFWHHYLRVPVARGSLYYSQLLAIDIQESYQLNRLELEQNLKAYVDQVAKRSPFRQSLEPCAEFPNLSQTIFDVLRHRLSFSSSAAKHAPPNPHTLFKFQLPGAQGPSKTFLEQNTLYIRQGTSLTRVSCQERRVLDLIPLQNAFESRLTPCGLCRGTYYELVRPDTFLVLQVEEKRATELRVPVEIPGGTAFQFLEGSLYFSLEKTLYALNLITREWTPHATLQKAERLYIGGPGTLCGEQSGVLFQFDVGKKQRTNSTERPRPQYNKERALLVNGIEFAPDDEADTFEASRPTVINGVCFCTSSQGTVYVYSAETIQTHSQRGKEDEEVDRRVQMAEESGAPGFLSPAAAEELQKELSATKASLQTAEQTLQTAQQQLQQLKKFKEDTESAQKQLLESADPEAPTALNMAKLRQQNQDLQADLAAQKAHVERLKAQQLKALEKQEAAHKALREQLQEKVAALTGSAEREQIQARAAGVLDAEKTREQSRALETQIQAVSAEKEKVQAELQEYKQLVLNLPAQQRERLLARLGKHGAGLEADQSEAGGIEVAPTTDLKETDAEAGPGNNGEIEGNIGQETQGKSLPDLVDKEAQTVQSADNESAISDALRKMAADGATAVRRESRPKPEIVILTKKNQELEAQVQELLKELAAKQCDARVLGEQNEMLERVRQKLQRQNDKLTEATEQKTREIAVLARSAFGEQVDAQMKTALGTVRQAEALLYDLNRSVVQQIQGLTLAAQSAAREDVFRKYANAEIDKTARFDLSAVAQPQRSQGAAKEATRAKRNPHPEPK